jgi:ribose transport system permease protein
VSTEESAEARTNRPAVKGPRFGDFSEIAIVLVFAAIVLYLSLTTSTLLSAPNIMAILVATSLIAVVACGQTFVIVTGGIDLSSGSVVTLSGVITGLVLHAGVPICASIIVGILVGLGCGLFNGLSVTYLNMNPFIVTLAAMSMVRGLAFIVPNGQTIFGFDDAFDSIGGGLWTIPGIGRAPIAGVISLAALAIGAFVLKKTVFGSEVTRSAGIAKRQ